MIKKKDVRAVGRPKELPANFVKSTVTFYNEQIVWLDRLSADIRSNTMAIVDRGSIIRAVISAVMKSGIDLTHLESEEQIRDTILKHLK